jgi:hypothetical protein
MPKSRWREPAYAFLAFAILAMVQTWPLPVNLATHLTGSPTGDSGVYVWNIWVFSHEIFSTGTTPLSTLEILPLSGPTDLSLHNYTVAADLMAMPLLPWLGVIRAFNIVYLANATLAGFGLFLLARRLTGRALESFMAGVMFAWSPFLVTRGLGHFSLAAAAPLPFFMLMLYRVWDRQRLRDAVLAGATLAWAAFSDPYYIIHCLMLGGIFATSRLLDVRFAARPAVELRGLRHLLDVAITGLLVLIVGVHVVAGGEVRMGAFRLSMHTLFTPMLVVTLLALARLAVATNFSLAALKVPSRAFVLRATVVCGIAAGILLSPTLYAMSRRAMSGDVSTVPVLWRSSAPGVDLLSLFLPNPNHPLAPAAMANWLAAGPGGYLDQVASLSLIGFAVLIAAWWLAGFRPPRLWLVITIGFALLSLGPFVQVARWNTQIPTPWAVLRYVPVIGSARMPARFMAVVTMGFSVLLAYALVALGQRFPNRRRSLMAVIGVLIAVELIAAPRTLYSASISPVFDVVKNDPRPVRVLELPTGIRDGLSSMGDFSAQAQFNQTYHGKGLIGGYLSRVPPSTKAWYRRLPVTAALIEISEGNKLTRGELDRAVLGADDFIRTTNLGYVVMDTARATSDLRDFATELLGLTKVAEADGYAVYVPRRPDRAARLPSP